MEFLTFRNALRLHMDSIKLFKTHSYPSSFVLSVLDLEELGKAHLLGDFVFYWGRDTRVKPEEEKKWFHLIYRHTVKQGAFHRNTVYELPKPFERQVFDGSLERLKQEAVYVGFENRENVKGRLRTPFSVTRKKAEYQITMVNDHLLAFCLGVPKGVYGWDNPMVESQLNAKLFNKLTGVWSRRRPKTDKLFKKLMSL